MAYKISFLILSLLGIGVPFNTPWHYGYAFLITFFLVFGKKRSAFQVKWIVVGLGILGGTSLIPQVTISEQQRLLVEHKTIISPQEFIEKKALYPFAQTADGFLQGLGRSRLVSDIDLTNDLSDLRSGYINQAQFNFYAEPIIREALPFVVCYKITEELLRRGLRGKGIFYYGGHFVTHASPTVITFKPELLGTSFYAFGSDRRFPETISHPFLSLKLIKMWQDHLQEAILIALKVGGIFLLGYGFFFFSRRAFDWRELLLLMVWVSLFLFDHGTILGREIVARGGSDGIVHGGFPYTMLENLAVGNWMKALASPESTFYFMPGMRYVRFIEMLVFGDSYPLQVMILFFTPLIYYRFFKALLPQMTAFILSSLMFIKALNFLGLSYKLHLVRFLKLYGENVSYACLVGALVMLIQKISSRWQGVSAFFLLFVAVSIRPNLLVFVAALSVAYFFFPVFSEASKKDKFIHLLGLSPLGLIPLHNIVFGHKWVLLTSATKVPANLTIPPHFYVEGLQCLVGFSSYCHVKDAFMKHFMGYGSLVVFFMATNFMMFCRQQQWNKVKVLSMATFFGLSMHLFYLANDRYLHPYLTLSVVLLILLVKDYRSKKYPA